MYPRKKKLIEKFNRLKSDYVRFQLRHILKATAAKENFIKSILHKPTKNKMRDRKAILRVALQLTQLHVGGNQNFSVWHL